MMMMMMMELCHTQFHQLFTNKSKLSWHFFLLNLIKNFEEKNVNSLKMVDKFHSTERDGDEQNSACMKLFKVSYLRCIKWIQLSHFVCMQRLIFWIGQTPIKINYIINLEANEDAVCLQNYPNFMYPLCSMFCTHFEQNNQLKVFSLFCCCCKANTLPWNVHAALRTHQSVSFVCPVIATTKFQRIFCTYNIWQTISFLCDYMNGIQSIKGIDELIMMANVCSFEWAMVFLWCFSEAAPYSKINWPILIHITITPKYQST